MLILSISVSSLSGISSTPVSLSCGKAGLNESLIDDQMPEDFCSPVDGLLFN